MASIMPRAAGAAPTMRRVTPGLWKTRGETRPGLAGPQLPARLDLVGGVHELRGLGARGHRGLGLLFDEDGARPAPADRTVARHLARRASRASRPAPGTATASPARGRPSRGCASTRTSCCSTRTPARSAATLVHDPAIFGARPGRARQPSTARLRAATCRAAWWSTTDFDWQGDAPLQRRWRDTVIYELHVKGMTQLHDRVPEELRGTYAGLASPAVTDYLRDLGVTAVELLPIHQFCTEPAVADARPDQLLGLQLDRLLRPARGVLRRPATGASRSPSSRQMVKAFHDAGLEVILDVVYNHTAEAGSTDRRCASAASTTRSTTGSRRRGRRAVRRHLLGRDRLRQHRRRRPPVRAADDPGLAALLGHRDARRRLPLRPALGAGPDRAARSTWPRTC